MQRAPKQLRFPLAGIAADIDYRRATLPTEDQDYATPASVNVIGECVFSGRMRGGSRPGLAALAGVTSESTGGWLWPNGDTIVWPSGDNMIFSALGSSVLLPDGSRILTPHIELNIPDAEGSPVRESASAGEIAAVYRDRLVAAAGSMWYASATGSFGDFDYSKDYGVVTRAAAGNTALAGRPAEDVTALVSVDDKMLFIATARSLRVISGEPTTGAASVVSEHVGIVSPWAWCRLGSAIYFLGARGLYGMTIGESPLFLSGRLPETLKGHSASSSPVLVADREREGVHILLGDGTAWYYDISAKAFWLQQYPSAIAPVNGGHAMVDGVDRTVFLCADGAWRLWDDSAGADSDGSAITSSVIIGPFRNGQRDNADGILDEITMTLGENSGEVDAFVHVGDSAEEAVEAAKTSATPAAEFTFGAGWNRNVRPRVRGAWCCITLASTGRWAFEGLLTISKLLGRLR